MAKGVGEQLAHGLQVQRDEVVVGLPGGGEWRFPRYSGSLSSIWLSVPQSKPTATTRPGWIPAAPV